MNETGPTAQSRFSVQLRNRRKELQLTQQELADVAGMSVAAIRDLEQGRRLRPRPASVALLATALRLTPSGARELAEASLEFRIRRVTCPDDPGAVHSPGLTGPDSSPAPGLRIRLLGPLTASHAAGQDIRLGPPRQRAVLALLALSANNLVRREQIIDVLWDDEPPRTATDLVQAYISRLRRALAPAQAAKHSGALLTSVGASYRLAVNEDELDLLAFRRLIRQARLANDEAAAYAIREQALALWCGDPLADIDALQEHPVLADVRAERAAAVLAYAAAAISRGWHEQALPHLRALTRWEPLNEQAHAYLMIALAGLGQQAAALQVYEHMRRLLDTQLGVRPGKHLTDAHLQVLRQDIPAPQAADEAQRSRTRIVAAAPVASTPGSAPTTASAAGGTATRSLFLLPTAPSDFTGRETECGQVLSVITQNRRMPVMAISGLPGIGKTALALFVAHQARDRFPDGQLWVQLGGSTGSPRNPGELLGELLRTIGIDGFPGDQAERAAIFRSKVAGRRFLVVADDAASVEQVTPLLPGTPGSAVIVTSRIRMEGLEGASILPIEVMTHEEAVCLLTHILGPARVETDPRAVSALAAACGELPLALRAVGSRLAAWPAWPVSAMTRRLARGQYRLRELTVGNLSVRTSIAMSYGLLPEHHQIAFLLLGGLGPAEFSEWVLPVLLGEPDSGGVLDDLLSRSLVTATGVDATGESRYRMHDLLREYALERLAEEPVPGGRAAASRRLLEAYLQLAREANACLPPDPRFPPSVLLPQPTVFPVQRARELTADPAGWFALERRNLFAAVEQACTTGQLDLARELADAQWAYQHLRAQYEDAGRLWILIANHSGPGDVYPRLRVAASLIARGRADEALVLLDGCSTKAADPEMLALALYWQDAADQAQRRTRRRPRE